MLEWIEFKNFKALRNARLPLSCFTLIVGANGSGKSTALNAVLALANPNKWKGQQLRTAGVPGYEDVTLRARWQTQVDRPAEEVIVGWNTTNFGRYMPPAVRPVALDRCRLFALDSEAVGQPVQLQPNIELERNGQNLAGVLDRLRDEAPERFEALNQELKRWIPEFDRVLFETPSQGARSIALRTRESAYMIKATDLSQGTLIALALLTIAYLPKPPAIVCLEEPDHGLHPRLLRDVKDALYRLAYPEGAKENREPVQVIATTHNPYFLDLFREHPEEIVIAEKVGLEGRFSRLSDRPDLDEILGDAPLSEVWYSGVLGGVPGTK